MDENLLISFLGELKTEAEYTAQQVAFTVNSEGKTIYYVLTRVLGDNGTAREIMRIVAPNATGTAYVATNMALLSMEVPTTLAFIGPALGVAIGAGVLSQTDPFQNIGTKIGESLYCFLNSDGQILFPEETIKAYAQKFIELGITNESELTGELYEIFAEAGAPTSVASGGSIVLKYPTFYPDTAAGNEAIEEVEYTTNQSSTVRIYDITAQDGSITQTFITTSTQPFTISVHRKITKISTQTEYEESRQLDIQNPQYFDLVIGEETRRFTWYLGIITVIASPPLPEVQFTEISGIPNCLQSQYPDYDPSKLSNMSWERVVSFVVNFGNLSVELQPGSVIPSSIPLNIPTTYPSWTPTKVYPDTGNEQTTYPISVPSTIPSTITTPQPEYQTPQPLLDPTTDPRTTQISQLIGDLVLPTPTPIPSPTPQPSPDPDPSPTVNPDPPLDPTQPVEPNPPSANTDPDPTTPTIVDPSLVSAAGKLFTVYNPSSTSLNDLGAYLWSTNIIDIVKSIWQNPMDGIISYFVLYATPEANRTSTIYLGALDSGVSSPVVTNQFIDIDCGEVQIKEKWNNIGDYPPYTSIKLFLPFVGFVDINPDDVMGRDDAGGFIKVTYRVDVYTGTCLAQVWVKRAADMANYQILYTYNGNCAQQIPLTGATYQGLMQTLVGASVGFASAGLTGALASAATQFAGHQQVQMQRSGNMSANAGVLGQRKPYLIISRNNVYYATNFAEYYGYPAHATVVLGNMSGYVRVRDIHLEVPATSEELDEIEALLKEGVWF